MREDPSMDRSGDLLLGPTDDTIVALPNLMSGRLADLLADAAGPGQEYELRGELAARTAFAAVAETWSPSRRRFRRTPAVLAVTTVATMMVATTGLAAASQLPGPAGRAVEGILGSVGVMAPPPATPAVSAPAPLAVGPTSGNTRVHGPSITRHVASTHGACSTGDGARTSAAAGGVETASCTIVAPATAPATPTPRATVHASAAAATGPSAPTVRTPRHGGAGGAGGSGTSGGAGGSTGGAGSGQPGGGTSRGGNQGAGGGTTCPGDGGTTTTTDPTGATATDASAASDPTVTSATDTTGAVAAAGCRTHGAGHHHGGGGASGGGAGATGGTTPVTEPTTP